MHSPTFRKVFQAGLNVSKDYQHPAPRLSPANCARLQDHAFRVGGAILRTQHIDDQTYHDCFSHFQSILNSKPSKPKLYHMKRIETPYLCFSLDDPKLFLPVSSYITI
jgi:hypothetical protein